MKNLFILVLFLTSLPGLLAQNLNNNGLHSSGDKNYTVKTFLDKDGKSIDEIIVPGLPPDKYRAPVAAPTRTAFLLSSVPGYDWSFGCSATSAAMISGYYDNNNYPGMYTGPANGGVAPMNNSVWGTVIINGEVRSQCPLSATRQGVDGRITRGSVDDYWIQYNNCDDDPYIQNGWVEHTAGECTGDYMGTNQSELQNCDGSTVFYFYTDGTPLYDYTGGEPGIRDGCHGLRLYFESRGYSIIQNYSQYIYGYNGNTLGFTFAQYKQEIDAGRPVLIQVSGHTMIGFGYDNPNVVYLHDTWDYSTHTMTWGGSYSGLQHYGVGVFQLEPVSNQIPVISITFPGNGADFTQPGITVTGNASDPDGSIDEVQVRLNGGIWETAVGTNSWSHPVTLLQGSNLIEARAIDNAGDPSGIAPVTVTYTPNSAPTLTWTGEQGYETDGVNPDEGDSTLTFTFRAKYTDVDGDAPLTGYPKLYLNKTGNPVTGSPFTMNEGNSLPFTTGRIYTIDINDLQVGTDYTYYFEAKDINNNPATGEATIEQNGPVVLPLPSSITLIQPSANITVEQGDPVTIEWQTINPSGSSVSLFMDTDNNWGNGNETPIDISLPLNGSYEWHTGETAPGIYYIAGTVPDGIENPYDYAEGIVTIINTFQLSVSVYDGWNMVSIPGLHPVDQNVETWWPYKNPAANVFRFEGVYQMVTEVTPGVGYWMKNSGDRIYNTGDEWPADGIQIVSHDLINTTQGWNMFGGYEDTINAAALTSIPPGKIIFPIYRYVPGTGYQAADKVVPGYGYWVKVSSACQVIIPGAMVKGNTRINEFVKDIRGKIIITDAAGSSYTLYSVKGQADLNKYELPPLPPAGLFDVRFGSGRAAEDINSGLKAIEMRGITYPVKVRAEGMDIRVQDATGKLVNTNLKDGEEIIISNPDIDKVMVSGELLPEKFALEQNYPNPFNPDTKIIYSIPHSSRVVIKVYDLLGNHIETLVNDEKMAGTYELTWNAANLPSGVYFYRIKAVRDGGQAGDFIQTKKMILLR